LAEKVGLIAISPDAAVYANIEAAYQSVFVYYVSSSFVQ
jgi:hypothetical protein